MTGFRTKPKPPTAVTASGIVTRTASAESYINVSWGAAPVTGQIAGGFNLYRNGVLLDTLPITARSYSDTTALAGITYSYAVSVVNVTAVESASRSSNVMQKPTRPTLSGFPATISVNANAQVSFAYGADVEGGVLTYSITSGPAGTSVNSVTGLVTFGSVSGTMVLRVTDGTGLYTESSCVVTVSASSGTVKWYPGNYAQSDAHMKPDKYAQHASDIASLASVPANRIVGYSLIVPWGQVETSQGVYNWSKVREYRNAIVAQGKRFGIDFLFGTYGTGSYINPDYFPAYAISAGLVGYSGSQTSLKFYRAAAMDRMIALYRAAATEFDNDEWVTLINSPETSFGVVAGDSDCTAANQVIQWKRLVDAIKVAFVRTPCTIQNNYLPSQSASAELNQYCVDNRVGLGAPDVILPEERVFNDQWLENWTKGYRWNGSSWVLSAADQTAKIAYSFGRQVVRSLTATPQRYHERGRDYHQTTHIVWQMIAQVTQYGGTTRIPAMDWANCVAYLSAAERTMRTTLPTNLG